MAPVLRRGSPDDIDALLRCYRAFYGETGHTLRPAAEAAIAALLQPDCPHGLVMVLAANGEIAGFASLCFGYSVEFGGRDAFLDDLYVSPALRGRGYGRELVTMICDGARASGCNALHLETEMGSRTAEWYATLGFALRGSLMSKRVG